MGNRHLVPSGIEQVDPGDFPVIGHILAPGETYALGGASRDFQEQVVLDGEGLERLFVGSQLGLTLALGAGLDSEGEGLVGDQFLLDGNGRGGHVFSKEGAAVGVQDREDIDLGILGHIPGEGDNVAQGRAHAGIQVHRLQAAGEIQLIPGDELLSGAGAQHDGRQGDNGIFDLIHSIQGIRDCHSHNRS